MKNNKLQLPKEITILEKEYKKQYKKLLDRMDASVSLDEDQLKELVLAIVGAADYDIVKQYDIETAEEPEYVEDNLNRLIAVAKNKIKSFKKKK